MLRARDFTIDKFRISPRYPSMGLILAITSSVCYRRNTTLHSDWAEMLGADLRHNLGDIHDSLTPAIYQYRFPELEVFAFEGTTNQWLAYLRTALGSRSTFDVLGNPDYGIERYFAPYAEACGRFYRANHQFDKPVVFTGHSLGGALAIITAGLERTGRSDTTAVWTFGAPRCITSAWARNFRIPVLRYEAAGDPIVPYQVPSGYALQWQQALDYAYPTTMRAPGVVVRVGELDREDLARVRESPGVLEEIYRAIESSPVMRVRRGERIGESHYSSNYCESVYEALPTDSKRAMVDYMWWAVREGISTPTEDPVFSSLGWPWNVPAPPPPPPEPVPPPPTLDAVVRRERSLLEKLISGRLVSVGLYTHRAVGADAPTLGDFTEAAYPGYARVKIPQTMRILDVNAVNSTTEDSRVEFRLSDDVAEPVSIAGVYAVHSAGNGEQTLLGFEELTNPIRLAAKGDKLSVRISLSTAELVVPE